MKKRFLSVLLCLIMALGLLPTAAFAGGTAPLTITSVAATITAPTFGMKPDTNPTLTSMPANGVMPGTVYWFKIAKTMYTGGSTGSWEAMAASETFDMEHYYKVNISAAAKSGVTFQSGVSGTVNGEECTVTDLFGQGKVLSYVFPEKQPAPEFPKDLDEIANLDKIKIGMICTQEPQGHSKLYGLIDGGVSSDGTVKMNKDTGAYEFTLTVDPSAYLNQFNTDTKRTHEFVNLNVLEDIESRTITVRYDSKTMKWSAVPNNGDMVEIGFFVECAPPAPAYPELDEISNLDKIKIGVLCAQEPKHNKLYGLIDGGVSSDGTVKMNKDTGAYEFTLTVDPSAYLNQFNTDTKRTHEFVNLNVLEDIESRTITVRYDSKTMKWSAVPNNGDMVEIGFFVKCEAPAAEYTVTLNGTGVGATGAGSYTAGAEVNIYAGTMSGYSFNGWTTTSTDVTILSASSKNASFVMPSHDVEVKANWIYNGGGVGGRVSAYTITVKDTKNGSVTADRKTASAGATVTLTVSPNQGWTLETLTAANASGKEIDLNIVKVGEKYTFKMPSSNVTVNATFMEDNTILNYFVDVPTDSYYYDAVLWAVDKGITRGTDAAHFSPDGICTRAQAVTFLWRAAGSPAPKTTTMPFTDVPAGSYYYDAVLWAVENGITKGTRVTEFSPDMNCSRAQIVTFLWRSEQSPAAGTVNPFTDVKPDAYYADAVLWAVKEDITKGTADTMFSPDADCTRAQIVTFIWRCMG